jgi:hypothetical protein
MSYKQKGRDVYDTSAGQEMPKIARKLHETKREAWNRFQKETNSA